ncbi:MAG: Lpp/OprI family alanine-zipper lipoprotein [Gammaproteobacteria bacterium]|nr:Lpp/OprI family alanine-zipper lipoprotein [Gammaproteobacteria bacterium]MDH3465124.1 Lpp/OprI family alanine-zipper lipoprotein [Gammaproteobacteria bacterium]
MHYKPLMVAGLLVAAVTASGCATTKQLNEVRSLAEQAGLDAASAQQSANDASNQAAQANQTAARAEQKADEALRIAQESDEKIERMFKKAMQK